MMPLDRHAGAVLRVAVVGEPTGWHVGRLLAALTARGHQGTVVRWTDLVAEVCSEVCSEIRSGQSPRGAGNGTTSAERFLPPAIDAADLVVVRGMPGGGLEEVVFRMDLLGRLAARGTPVVNSPRGLEIAIDKYLSLARMATAGLSVPRTIVAQSPDAIRAAWHSLGRDCVAKPIFGSRGRGIARITDEASLVTLIDAATAAPPAGSVAYLQEFLPHEGWDVRILLVGKDAFAMRRFAVDGEWRTNVSLGGRPEAFSPPADWVELARAAARAVETEIAGVDLLPARDGRVVVLEVNAVPGWQGLEAATGIPVADAIVRHLECR
jgi:ribosomal protein S6--L-glutamate ligase